MPMSPEGTRGRIRQKKYYYSIINWYDYHQVQFGEYIIYAQCTLAMRATQCGTIFWPASLRKLDILHAKTGVFFWEKMVLEKLL